MKIIITIIFVGILLTHYVASVTRRIYENIVGLLLETAFDDRFEIFVIGLEIFKRQIVHVDYETVITVLDLSDDIIQISELMLIDFDNPESPVVISVQNPFDTAGFTGSGITGRWQWLPERRSFRHLPR